MAQNKIPFAIDHVPLVRFMISTLILTPFSFFWLETLESRFPGTYQETPATTSTSKNDAVKKEGKQKPKEKLNIRNTIVKILLDQTVGGLINSTLFIVTISALQGHDVDMIREAVRKDLFPLMLAGLKLWPMVSVISFALIPADKRILFGGFFGMGWGIYLSLMAEG